MLEAYEENGHLMKRWDKNGIQTIITYEEGKPVKISHNGSACLKMCYNDNGELTGVSDHAGREVTFAYTGKKLSSVTDPEGNCFTYEYGSNGRIAGMLDKRGVCIVENTYDEYRRITKQTFPDGGVIQIAYTDKHNRVKLTAQNGSSVRYIHDSRFRDKKTVYEDGYEEWTYDKNGHVSRRRDKNGNETFYVHDKDGRLIETKDALGAVTTNTYDKTGHPAFMTNEQGDILFEFLDGYKVGTTIQNIRIDDYNEDGFVDVEVEIFFKGEKIPPIYWYFQQDEGATFHLESVL